MTLKDVPAHERVLQDLVMDILRVLASPDLEVRKKTLSLVLDLISPRNVEEVSASFDHYCNGFDHYCNGFDHYCNGFDDIC